MAEAYIPKVGDKVRATLGENVLVGKIDWIAFKDGSPHNLDIRVNEMTRDGQISLYMIDGWRFEQVVDVPTKPFAVVAIDASYAAYVRVGVDDWINTFNGGSASDATIADLIRDEGYRVVFEGVDK